nr:hypothetical protein [Nonomuraea sp. SYSU D8015]
MVDLSAVDHLLGGVVGHGLEGHVRPMQQVGDHLGRHLLIDRELVHGLDLLLDGEGVVDLEADHPLGGVRGPAPTSSRPVGETCCSPIRPVL